MPKREPEMVMASRAQEVYSPLRSKTPKRVLWALLLAASAWAIVNITGGSTMYQTLTVILGAVLVVGVGILAHRQWKAHEVIPTQIRAAAAYVFPIELRRGSVKTVGYRFGSLLNPTAPRKVIIRSVSGQSPLPDLRTDPKMRGKLISAVSEMAGALYRIDEKKSRPGQKVLLRRLSNPDEPEEKLTDTQKTDRKISTAATELLGEGTKVESTWEKTPGAEDYLSEVVITAADGKQLALANKKKTTLAQLRTRLPGADFNAQVDPSADQIRFKRKVPLPAVVVPPAEHAELIADHEAYKQFQVPIAIGDGGEQVIWHPAKNPHCLIVGGTGTGKTVAEHGVIQALAQAGWRIWLVDGKRLEFLGYEDYPNVEFLAQRLDDQIRLIYQAHEIMEQRMELLRTKQVSKADLDPIAVVIDEVSSLKKFIGDRYAEIKSRTKGLPAKDPVMGWLDNIARLARSMKVHLVYGLQRPDTTIVSGESRDNFAARISMGALESSDGSVMMWGNGAIGRQVPDIQGRGIGRINGAPAQVQVAFTANPDEAHEDYHSEMVAAQWPRTRVHTQKWVSDAVASDSELGVTWADILAARITDDEGQTIDFDPVSSPESRELRAHTGSRAKGAGGRLLRTAASMEEALALFTATGSAGDTSTQQGVEPGTVEHSLEVLVKAVQISPFLPSSTKAMNKARRIAARSAAGAKRGWRRADKGHAASQGSTSSQPPGGDAPRSSDESRWQDVDALDEDTVSTATEPGKAAEVRENHRLLCDELEEEILVGDVTPIDSGVIITGYTDQGQEHVIELAMDDPVHLGEDTGIGEDAA